MTFSIVARCARTGMFGAAVTSSSPAVAARCAFARAGVGAACSQNITDPTLGPSLLTAVARTQDASSALGQVVAAASHPAYRQLTLVDSHGRTASHCGEHTLGRYAVASAANVLAAGNLLADGGVPAAMVARFEQDPEAPLADRLLAALRAGSEAGGEEDDVHSAGLLVVDKVSWPVTDLRVDWSDQPLADLEALWSRWAPQAADYVTRALDPQTAPSYGVAGDL